MATGISVPVLRVSGVFALIVCLYVVAIFGSLHLLALSKPQSKTAQAWLGALGF